MPGWVGVTALGSSTDVGITLEEASDAADTGVVIIVFGRIRVDSLEDNETAHFTLC